MDYTLVHIIGWIVLSMLGSFVLRLRYTGNTLSILFIVLWMFMWELTLPLTLVYLVCCWIGGVD